MGVLSIQLNKQRKPTGYLLQKMTGGEWEMYLHYQPAAQSSQHHEAPLDFSLSCGEPIDVLAGAVPLDAGLTEFEGGGTHFLAIVLGTLVQTESKPKPLKWALVAGAKHFYLVPFDAAHLALTPLTSVCSLLHDAQSRARAAFSVLTTRSVASAYAQHPLQWATRLGTLLARPPPSASGTSTTAPAPAAGGDPAATKAPAKPPAPVLAPTPAHGSAPPPAAPAPAVQPFPTGSEVSWQLRNEAKPRRGIIDQVVTISNGEPKYSFCNNKQHLWHSKLTLVKTPAQVQEVAERTAATKALEMATKGNDAVKLQEALEHARLADVDAVAIEKAAKKLRSLHSQPVPAAGRGRGAAKGRAAARGGAAARPHHKR